METTPDRNATPAGPARSEEYGELQRLVDALFATDEVVTRLDAVVRAEMDDLSPDLVEVVELLPAGSYRRARLCDQMNSIITAHGWGYVYGTVE